ncbi:MAG: NAD-dependent DNA ligase LigA, partial [Nitrospinaceae bacterium]|nr:NAD-dependent DNA ligase LigA [Nitrospinaceae bacterium]NIR54765.1 NAD-dependent DNA ligase LigA [Nitrospinaceae bacterium]NIS85190.1 NAD-dependent DNA ligase LigA [Nitrospinaceae bacterium]NIT82001.1 NAD-dependent DNA ligase LigA [Nitrospinaceae bacterium]NIU44264.1 NAD-dependent DNA ligase LigA [Nitrospinaceae bacterium]
IRRLVRKGVGVEETRGPAASRRLEGKQFVLTGSLNEFTRDQASEKIAALGGRVTSSVSSKTDYVVVGENPGSKLDRAKKLGVNVLQESQFKKLLEGKGTDQ